MAIAVAVKSLGYSIAGRRLFWDLSFQVNCGEILVILGENGVGKSTLLECLIAEKEPQEGEVFLCGQPLAQLSTAERARMVTMLRQEHSELFPYSVAEVVMMGRVRHIGLFAQPAAQDRHKVAEVLAFIGITALAERNFNTLSRGEKQLVLLARAFVQEADVLLLDEPTNHLDFANQYRFLELIKRLCRELKKSVIAVIHDPNQALRLADTVLLLQQGGVLAYGTVANVINETNMQRLYGIEVKLFERGKSLMLGTL